MSKKRGNLLFDASISHQISKVEHKDIRFTPRGLYYDFNEGKWRLEKGRIYVGHYIFKS